MKYETMDDYLLHEKEQKFLKGHREKQKKEVFAKLDKIDSFATKLHGRGSTAGRLKTEPRSSRTLLQNEGKDWWMLRKV